MVVGERADVGPFPAEVAQFEPASSRLRVMVPGQQPCLEDKHNLASRAFVVDVAVVAVVVVVVF